MIIYDVGVFNLFWPGNSPDLNMIEPCWPWMKRQKTRQGASSTQELLEKAWINCWDNKLSMKCIQTWIEQIPWHIQEVIRLKKGNKYWEGRFGDTLSVCPYNSQAQKEQYQRRKAGIRPSDQTKEEISKEEKVKKVKMWTQKTRKMKMKRKRRGRNRSTGRRWKRRGRRWKRRGKR